MSSPFTIFRKYQRSMMVVIGVMCILAFTVLGSVQTVMDSGPGDQDPVVVTSKYGDITRNQIGEMRFRRTIAKQFLMNAMMQLFPGINPQQQQQAFMMVQRKALMEFGPTTDTDVVQTHILAAMADEMGMIVTDESLDSYIAGLTENVVSADQLTAALHSLRSGRNQRISMSQLYDALRPELKAQRMRFLFQSSLQSTPAERWEFFLQLKRQAKVEYAAIPTESFVSQVKDPSDTELRTFFDKHRDQLPEPGSSVPGFKVPHEAAFQFFRADWQHFLKKNSVTDEEIAAHYEKFKGTRYHYREGQLVTEERPEIKVPPAAETEDKPATDEKPKDDAKPADEKKPEAEPAKTDDAKKADEPAKSKGDEQSATDATNLIFPGDELAQADDKAAPAAAADKAAPAKTAEIEKTAPAEKAPAADKPAEKATGSSATTEPAKTDAKPEPTTTDPFAQPGTQGLPSTDPFAFPGTPGTTATSDPTVIAPPTLVLPYILPNDVLDGPNPLYEPLWAVEESIRDELAVGRAEREIQQIFDQLSRPLSAYSAKWSAAKNRGEEASVGSPPDFEALASKFEGISAAQTPLVSALELQQFEGFGKSTDEGRSVADFWLDKARQYQILRSQDLENNQYLYWKSQDVPEHVPELSKIRPEVVRTWKMHQARDLARKRGEELLKIARASDKSLSESLASEPGLKVGDTGYFSWLTQGSASQADRNMPARLSEVTGLDEIGNEFMQTVFDLNPGESGFALNQPQTIGYVVRVVQTKPPVAVLQTEFAVEDARRTYQAAAFREGSELYQDWLDQQLVAADVEWKESPNDELDD